MLIIYSEPKFVGRDSCYKLLPPTFLCELSNKIDQTLQWIESRSNGFNSTQPNTNVHIFHDKIAEFTTTTAAIGDLKASERGLIAGSDEGSRPVVSEGGNYVGTLGISKLARKAHVGQTPTRVKSKEQRAEANWTKYVDLHNCAVWVWGTRAILPKSTYVKCTKVKLPSLAPWHILSASILRMLWLKYLAQFWEKKGYWPLGPGSSEYQTTPYIWDDGLSFWKQQQLFPLFERCMWGEILWCNCYLYFSWVFYESAEMFW